MKTLLKNPGAVALGLVIAMFVAMPASALLARHDTKPPVETRNAISVVDGPDAASAQQALVNTAINFLLR